jgi:hypothetical protein
MSGCLTYSVARVCDIASMLMLRSDNYVLRDAA